MSFSIKMGRSRRAPRRLAWLHRMRAQTRGKSAYLAVRLRPASRRARRIAGERVMGARHWTAPQLHRAAGYVENELGPRFGALLSSTARRVEPPRGHRIRNAALVVVGTLGVIGIIGALFTRYKFMRETYDETAGEVKSRAGTIPHRAPTVSGVPSESADRADRPNSM